MINTLEEQLVAELHNLYDAEQRFLAFLQWTLPQVIDDELRSLLRTHSRETQQHVKNIEKAFQILRETPVRIRSQAAAGIIDEVQEAMREASGSPYVHDCVAAGAMLRVEHYEIASYRVLIELAVSIAPARLVELLRDNLQQEEQTGRRLIELVQHVTQSAQRILPRAA